MCEHLFNSADKIRTETPVADFFLSMAFSALITSWSLVAITVFIIGE